MISRIKLQQSSQIYMIDIQQGDMKDFVFLHLICIKRQFLRQMISNLEDEINSLIYTHPLSQEPSRYQMIRYSTWRIYFFQEFEAMSTEKITALKGNNSWIDKYPNLTPTIEEREFYEDFLNNKKKDTYRQDIISHFICRMLYCQDSNNHSKFIEMEREILRIRLLRKKAPTMMNLLKNILGVILDKKSEDFNVPEEDWKNFGHKMIRKDINWKYAENINEMALVPLEYGESGLKKRFSFVRAGNVYLNIDNTIELVVNLYSNFLREKLDKTKVLVVELLNNDVENQMSGFLRKTLQTLNTSNFDESVINSQFKLNIKNIDGLWKKYFPPCMLNLNQKLKQYNHLKHEGRRQLWLFLKGCGMDANDNQAYFHKHLASKVSGSELKGHMYNIQHAYGLVGKKQPERPKNCRNIITNPAPKKDEHHGCPFSHWRTEDLKEYIRKNYNISQASLEEVIKEKEINHFQVACGRLFEGTARSEGITSIPSEITDMLGKSPHEYFLAGMDLTNFTNTKGQDRKEPKQGDKASIKF